MQTITLWGAEQFGEQDTRGSIGEGTLADFVVLSDKSVTIDPQDFNRTRVPETVNKAGKSVWDRK